jgi:hypothetical protein
VGLADRELLLKALEEVSLTEFPLEHEKRK